MPALLTSEGAPMPPSNLKRYRNISTSHNKKPTTFSLQRQNPTNSQPHFSHRNNSINSTTYASILESCNCPNLGKQVHAHTLKTGFNGHGFIETKLLQMYCRCGSIDNASLMFEKMPQRNMYSWKSILTVFCDHGHFENAISLLQELLLEEDICLEFFVFPVVFKACGGLSELELGRQVHGFVVKSQFVLNTYVGNALIDMYGKCERLDDAKKFLAKMPERDCVSWNSVVTGGAANGLVSEALEFLESMRSSGDVKPNIVTWSSVIGGFVKNGYDKEALDLISRMQEDGFKPNAQTIASVLPAVARLQTLSLGKEFHGYITRQRFMFNDFVVNGLVDVYRRCADMGSALKIFSKFSARNLVLFNTMIVGYCENGEVAKAKELFDRMEFVGVEKDTISWNSMISGYVGNRLFDRALELFRTSQFGGVEASSFTLGSALTACADLASLREGKEMHSYAIRRGLHSNPFVGGSLVELYCKCNDVVAARMVFNGVIERDTTTWNVLISGYARSNQMDEVDALLVDMKIDGIEPNIYTWNSIIAGCMENGENESALKLFNELQNSNLNPDIYTVGIIIPACSRLAIIGQGKQIHAHSVRHRYDTDVHIGASLVDMYAKCGSIKHARRVFNRILKPNLVSWNSILAGYAMHGHGEEGISLFRKMLVKGIRPDSVTFLSVLSSCVHVGLVELGYKYFDLMVHYGVEPTLKHHTCMVDLLSRAGRLREAYDLVKKTRVQPDPVMWGALLGGCVIHSNVELGEIAAAKLMELEPDNTGNHVLLANLYASTGRWDSLGRTRQTIADKRMHKIPGCSWIEDRDQIHVFLASDKSHAQVKEIYETVDSLTFHISKEGYSG